MQGNTVNMQDVRCYCSAVGPFPAELQTVNITQWRVKSLRMSKKNPEVNGIHLLH